MHLTDAARVLILLLAVVLAGAQRFGRRGRPLIKGGSGVQPDVVPWHASIYQPHNNSFTLVCGGTLVDPSWVLTAAHCFYGGGAIELRLLNLNTWKVALGNYHTDWNDSRHSSDVQRFDVERVVIHPSYRGYLVNYEYDIALIQMSGNALITTTTRIANIDVDNRLQSVGTSGILAGRGYYDGSNQLSPELRIINLPLVDRESCENTLLTSELQLLTSDKFCAGFVGQNRSACPGDSGGGLVYIDRASERPFVRGIVSISFRESVGCYSKHYTAFTNVTDLNYLRWLKETAPDVFTSITCDPVSLLPNDMNYNCHMDEEAVECHLPAFVGTGVIVHCQPGFVRNTNDVGKMFARCTSNGKWSERLIKCHARTSRGSGNAGTTNRPTVAPDSTTVRPTVAPGDGYTVQPSCRSNQYRCPSGLCIQNTWRCDGRIDCPGGEDESNCHQSRPTVSPVCDVGEFRCASGLCIDNDWRCDGQDDCPAGDDETHCTTQPPGSPSCWGDQFRCYSGRCIPNVWRCDGRAECPDGDDETNCPYRPSAVTPAPRPICAYRCHNGPCVTNNQRCDDRRDCPLGEDEYGCGQSMSNAELQAYLQRQQFRPGFTNSRPLQPNYSPGFGSASYRPDGTVTSTRLIPGGRETVEYGSSADGSQTWSSWSSTSQSKGPILIGK